MPAGFQIILPNEASLFLLYSLMFGSLKFTYRILPISVCIYVKTPSLKYVPIGEIYLEKKIIVYFMNRARNLGTLWGKGSILTLKYVMCFTTVF